MNIRQLQLDDLVSYSGKVCRVTAVRLDNDGKARAVVENDDFCGFVDEIEPIPLTPEILEKNGFEDVGQDIYQYEEKPYYIWWESDRYRLGIYKDESDYEKECFGEVMRLPIIYVHELQHALRLCGIEKKIEL